VESSFLTAVLLPIALGVIMLGLGLSLTIADFKRVVLVPRAVLVGLACQMLVLPAACLLIAESFDLAPELAVGLMLLAASPGGATANLFSHLARGDVALNITLTAVNSVLSLLTLPFIVNFAMARFMGEGRSIPLPFDKVVQVFAIVLIPVAIGMALRARSPALAERLGRPVKILSLVFLILVVVATIAKERNNVVTFIQQIGLAALVFNLTSMLVGYAVPRLVRIEKRQAIAIGMEIGIHNGTLAITIASSPMLLGNSTMAIPAAVYSVIMFFTAAAFGLLVNRRPAA
jgi:bile acid:Na+ symporter, BASS family